MSTTYKGIDVSKWQAGIDWGRGKGDGGGVALLGGGDWEGHV